MRDAFRLLALIFLFAIGCLLGDIKRDLHTLVYQMMPRRPGMVLP